MKKISDKVPKRSSRCSLCEKPFTPKERLFSMIVDGERIDGCRTCWEKEELANRAAESRWRVRVPEKPTKEEQQLTGEERLLALLVQAIETKGSEERALLLALYLERRGIIERVKMRRTSIDYKARRFEQQYRVRRVSLDAIAPEVPTQLVSELEAAYAGAS